MEDFLLLEMPVFQPHYKKWKKYGYTNSTEKVNLKDTAYWRKKEKNT